jgi:hypothetical protein
MSVPAREPYIYQIRSGVMPVDILHELTHAVWGVLMRVDDFKPLDPHRWPTLYNVFRAVFQSRLAHYDGCGDLHQCERGLKPYWPQDVPPSHWNGDTFTLELAQSLEKFVAGVAVLMERRSRAMGRLSRERRRSLAWLMESTLREVLARHIHFSELCRGCKVRRYSPDRRILTL